MTSSTSAFRFAYRLIENPYPLTVLPPQGEAVTRWLMTDEVSETFEIVALRPLTRLQVSAQYLGLGFTHILPKGPGPHPVRHRAISAQHQAEAAALACHGLHHRAHHHPWAGDLRSGLTVAGDR